MVWLLKKADNSNLIEEAKKYDNLQDFINNILTEKLYFNMVVADIKSKIANTGIRITPNSIGVLKGNIRGSWMDNEEVWTFYPTKPIHKEFVYELIKRFPLDVKVMTGAIDFPKEKYSSIDKLQLVDIWDKAHNS